MKLADIPIGNQLPIEPRLRILTIAMRWSPFLKPVYFFLASVAGLVLFLGSRLVLDTDFLEKRYESSRLVVMADRRAEVSDSQVSQLVRQIEQRIRFLEELMSGYPIRFRSPLVVNLGARLPGEPFRPPFYDGELHLFRNHEREILDFTDSLTHELVHALRGEISAYHEVIGDWDAGFLFVEEGFAGLVTEIVDSRRPSFPFWGSDPHAFSSFLIQHGYGIPLLVVLKNWRSLFVRCSIQEYALAISFFKFLYETYGREKVFEFSFSKKKFTEDQFHLFFDRGLNDLETEWKVYLKANYESIDDRGYRMEAYWPKWKDAFCSESVWQESIQAK